MFSFVSCCVGTGWDGFWACFLVSLLFFVFFSLSCRRGWQQSQQRDRRKNETVSCGLITAVWEVLCTWQSPARQSQWRRRSLSARKWSSSGLPEPCACERKPERRRTQVRRRKIFTAFVKAQGELPNDKTSHVSCPVGSSWIRTIGVINRNTCSLLTFGFSFALGKEPNDKVVGWTEGKMSLRSYGKQLLLFAQMILWSSGGVKEEMGVISHGNY